MARKKKVDTETMVVGNVDLGQVDLSPASSQIDFSQPVFSDVAQLGFWHRGGKEVPSKATAGSAGMDLSAYLVDGEKLKYYNHSNQSLTKVVRNSRIVIEPGERFLIPTGLHADIPDNTYLAIHSRSGTSWKNGLILTNGVAVIDSDYVEEIFVSLTNISGVRVIIGNGDRIAQALLMPVTQTDVKPLSTKPVQKTERAGGFGSTGSR